MRRRQTIPCGWLILLPFLAFGQVWPSTNYPMTGSFERGNQAVSGSVSRYYITTGGSTGWMATISADFGGWWFSQRTKCAASKTISGASIDSGKWVFYTNSVTPDDAVVITRTGLTARVGVGADWFTSTPYFNLAMATNGWAYLPQAFDELTITEWPVAWTNSEVCHVAISSTNVNISPSSDTGCTNMDWWLQDKVWDVFPYANITYPDIDFSWWLTASELYAANPTITLYGSEYLPCDTYVPCDPTAPYYIGRSTTDLDTASTIDFTHNWCTQTGPNCEDTGWAYAGGVSASAGYTAFVTRVRSSALATGLWTGVEHRVYFFCSYAQQPYIEAEVSPWTTNAEVASSVQFGVTGSWDTAVIDCTAWDTVGVERHWCCQPYTYETNLASYDQWYDCGTVYAGAETNVEATLAFECGGTNYYSYTTNVTEHWRFVYDTNAVAFESQSSNVTYYTLWSYCWTNPPAPEWESFWTDLAEGPNTCPDRTDEDATVTSTVEVVCGGVTNIISNLYNRSAVYAHSINTNVIVVYEGEACTEPGYVGEYVWDAFYGVWNGPGSYFIHLTDGVYYLWPADFGFVAAPLPARSPDGEYVMMFEGQTLTAGRKLNWHDVSTPQDGWWPTFTWNAYNYAHAGIDHSTGMSVRIMVEWRPWNYGF